MVKKTRAPALSDEMSIWVLLLIVFFSWPSEGRRRGMMRGARTEPADILLYLGKEESTRLATRPGCWAENITDQGRQLLMHLTHQHRAYVVLLAQF